MWKGSSETDHNDELHTCVYMGIENGLLWIFIYNLYSNHVVYPLWVCTIFTAICCGRAAHSSKPLSTVFHTLHKPVPFLPGRWKLQMCRFPPYPHPPPTPLSKALRCSRHLCFSSHFFSSLIKKKLEGYFPKHSFYGRDPNTTERDKGKQTTK